jgi:hypothetical protein
MRVITRRPRKSRTGVVLVVATIIATLILTSYISYLIHGDDSSPIAPAPTASTNAAPVTASPAQTTGTAKTFEELDNQTALRTLDKHIEHYACRPYPVREALETTDLIPTANVVVTAKYNSKTKRYEASNDKRVKMVIGSTTEPAGSDLKQPTTFTTLTWTYTSNEIKHFIVAEEFYDSYGEVHISTLASVYDQQAKHYKLSLPTSNTPVYTYRIIATDTTTCEGKNTLTDKWWAQPQTYGLMAPDPVN